MELKYKLLENEAVELEGGRKLYRIEALKDFGDVHTGDKGGFIEYEENLSHIGDCWVYGSACVMNNAKVYDNAKISDYALVYGNAKVGGNSEVSDKCAIHENAAVFEDAKLSGIIDACGNAKLHGNLNTCGAFVFAGDADVAENRHYFVAYPMTILVENEKYKDSERGYFVPVFFRGFDNKVHVINTLSEDENVICTPVDEFLKLFDTEEYIDITPDIKQVIADLCTIALSYIKI